MNTLYATRNEATEREITAALGAYATDHNIEAIADEALEYVDGFNGTEYRLDRQGYRLREDLTADDFWAIVAKHAK